MMEGVASLYPGDPCSNDEDCGNSWHLPCIEGSCTCRPSNTFQQQGSECKTPTTATAFSGSLAGIELLVWFFVCYANARLLLHRKPAFAKKIKWRLRRWRPKRNAAVLPDDAIAPSQTAGSLEEDRMLGSRKWWFFSSWNSKDLTILSNLLFVSSALPFVMDRVLMLIFMLDCGSFTPCGLFDDNITPSFIDLFSLTAATLALAFCTTSMILGNAWMEVALSTERVPFVLQKKKESPHLFGFICHLFFHPDHLLCDRKSKYHRKPSGTRHEGKFSHSGSVCLGGFSWFAFAVFHLGMDITE